MAELTGALIDDIWNNKGAFIALGLGADLAMFDGAATESLFDAFGAGAEAVSESVDVWWP